MCKILCQRKFIIKKLNSGSLRVQSNCGGSSSITSNLILLKYDGKNVVVHALNAMFILTIIFFKKISHF